MEESNQNPPVLVPENCEAFYGLPPHVNNTDCPICRTRLVPGAIVTTHTDCRTGYCSSCLLQWHAASDTHTCPNCRGPLGRQLVAPGCDGGEREIWVTEEGMRSLRALVGDAIYERFPLEARLVCTRHVLDVYRFPELKPEMTPDASNEQVAQAQATRSLLRKLLLGRGVTLLEEYRFLEWKPEVHCFLPRPPVFRVFGNIDDLTGHIRRRERYVSFDRNTGVGRWITMRCGSRFLRAQVVDNPAAVQIISDVITSCGQERDPTLIWASYSPGDSMENIIYACPSKVFDVHFFGIWNAKTKPGKLRAFIARDGGRQSAPGPVNNRDRHTALRQYPGDADNEGHSTTLPSGTFEISDTEDLGLARLFGPESDMANDSNVDDDAASVDSRDSRTMNYMFGIE
jgi:hypothetical protein